MKRTITLVAILCAFLLSHAQVNIQAKVKDYEFLGQLVRYSYSSKKYSLYVCSENPYEDKVVRIHIGDNATEAYESLENIYELFQRPGVQFEIGRYSVIVDNMCCIRVLKHGDLYYTAGNYYILSHELLGSKAKVKRRMKLEQKNAQR